MVTLSKGPAIPEGDAEEKSLETDSERAPNDFSGEVGTLGSFLIYPESSKQTRSGWEPRRVQFGAEQKVQIKKYNKHK